MAEEENLKKKKKTGQQNKLGTNTNYLAQKNNVFDTNMIKQNLQFLLGNGACNPN